MKKAKRILAILLVFVMTFSFFSGCGPKKSDGINRAQVTLPAPTQAEEVVDVTASLAVNYYLTARAYLDKFIDYDIEDMNEEEAKEFAELLNNAVETFEVTEKLSGALTEAVDVWETSSDDAKPTYKALSVNGSALGFDNTVYAAVDSSAQKWAQDIVDAFDKAPAGKGIRTLAEQLGTDAKHAYAQLKQATAILEGAEYTAIADKANTAVQVATGLKAAGTAAGLVIAVAAAPAAGTLGAVVKTGGVVCSGINTVLEVGSAGSIIYNNGEENEISIACDKTEAQFAPIGQVFSIMGLGTAIKDIGTTGKQVLESGYKSLTPKQMNDLGENAFGVISYTATSVNDYVNDGSVLSGTFKVTDKGTEFTLVDTLTGTEKEAVDNVKAVLTEAGIDKDKVDAALDAAKTSSQSETSGTATNDNTSNTESGSDKDKAPESNAKSENNSKPENETSSDDSLYGDNIPDEVADGIIETNSDIVQDDFDIDAYLDNLRNVLYEIAAMQDEDENSDEPESEPEESEPEESEEEPPVETGLSASRVAGTYSISGYDGWEDFEDDFYSGVDHYSLTLVIEAKGKNSLTMKAYGEDAGDETISMSNYDPTTGTCSFTDTDGTVIHISFSESGESISFNLNYNQTFEDGRSYGSYSGMKE